MIKDINELPLKQLVTWLHQQDIDAAHLLQKRSVINELLANESVDFDQLTEAVTNELARLENIPTNDLPAWTDATYGAGWGTQGLASTGKLQYYIHDGVVHLRGRVTSSNVQTTIATLPAECRPDRDLVFPTPYFGGTGAITISDAAEIIDSTNTAGSRAVTWLDTISYRAE